MTKEQSYDDQFVQGKLGPMLVNIDSLKRWFERDVIKKKISYYEFSDLLGIALSLIETIERHAWDCSMYQKNGDV